MNFYIRHKSDLPYLHLKFTNNDVDTLNDLKASDISFEIQTFDRCKTLVKCGKGYLIENIRCENLEAKYFIQCKIPSYVTNTIGKYRLKITITKNQFKHILPLKEDIIINVF